MMPFVKQIVNGNTISIVPFDEKLDMGRALENDLVIDDPTVSQFHARIHFEAKDWVLEDCGSTNGILIDGAKQTRVTLAEGGCFTIGTQAFEFCLSEPEGLDKTLRIKKSWIPGVYYTE